MHTFLVRSLNQQGFLIRGFNILSVTARDLTHKSAARPTGPIHASHIFPCEKETLNYHQGHRKEGKPCNTELVLTAPVLAAFSESRVICRKGKHGQEHCCSTVVLTGCFKRGLVPLELAQFIFLCQWEITFAQERQSHSLSDLISKNN